MSAKACLRSANDKTLLSCVARSARAQAVVADNAISISPGDLQDTQCGPDRQTRDTELLAALAQVTNWRRHGDVVELLGVTPLRFRLMTN
jgi:META domain